MSVTFRDISAQSRWQGGGSVNNMVVNNNMTSTYPLFINPNETLVNSLSTYLKKNLTFIRGLAYSVRIYVEGLVFDVNSVVPLIQPTVGAQLSSSATFISSVAQYLTREFPFSAITNDPTFIPNLVPRLYPYSNALISTSLQASLFTRMQAFLAGKFNLIQVMSTALLTYQFTKAPSWTAQIATSISETATLNKFAIGTNLLFSGVKFRLFQFTLLPKSGYLAVFNFVVLVTDSGYNVLNTIVDVVRQDTGEVFQTLYSQTFSPLLTVQPIGFTSLLTNTTTASIVVNVRLSCETTTDVNGIKSSCQALGTATVYRTTLASFVYPPFTFETPMPLLGSSVNVYDSSSSLVRSITSPYLGILQYSLGKPTWNVNVNRAIKSYLAQGNDFHTYLAATVNGPATINTSPVATLNVYNGGTPMILVQYDSTGTAKWIANMYAVGNGRETVSGVVTDAAYNVYVYGTHVCGTQLFAYNAGNSNPTLIDNSPATNPTSGQVNEAIAFVVKYSPSGVILGIATVKGDHTMVINKVSIDPTTNAVFLSGSTTTQTTTIITGFNRGQLTLPTKARGFFVRLNNVGQSNVTEWAAILSPTSFNSTATGVIVSGVQAVSDKSSNCFAYYKTSETNLDVYSFNNYDASSLSSQLGAVAIVKYTMFGDISWIVSVTSSFIIDDIAQQFCIDDDAYSYATFRTQSNAQLVGITTLTIEPTETDVTFLIRVPDTDRYAVQVVDTLKYVQISNSLMNDMYVRENMLYVSYQFTNVSKVYVGTARTLISACTVGAAGKSGNCVLRFNDTTTMVPTLVGFYLTT